jgi:hypothetical protein
MLLDDGRGESIIGIASFIDNSTCGRDSFYQRVDTQLAWVDEQLAKYDPAGGGPAGDGGTGDARAGERADAGLLPDASGGGAPGSDARAPALDSAAPPAGSPRDAAARDAVSAPAPDPDPTPGPDGTGKGATASAGGCTYAGTARPPLIWAAVMIGAAAWLRRRRRRCAGPTGRLLFAQNGFGLGLDDGGAATLRSLHGGDLRRGR